MRHTRRIMERPPYGVRSANMVNCCPPAGRLGSLSQCFPDPGLCSWMWQQRIKPTQKV